MSPADLSICIVNWNGRELLRACLESIELAQAGLRVETIVVDNASRDGSAEMVGECFPEVILVRNPTNAGFSRANNQAAALSSGRYLLFLNNDTLVGEGSLRALVQFMAEHPEVGLAGPRLIGRDGLPQRSYRYHPTLAALLHRLTLIRWTGLFRKSYEEYRRREFDPNTLRPVEALLGAAVCMPNEVFRQHGGWDEGFPFGLEDFDLSARVARSHQVIYLAGADIVHLGKMSSRKNAGFAYTGVECGYARYLRKHALSAEAVFGYKALVLLNLPFAVVVETIRAVWRRVRRGPAPKNDPHTELGALLWFATRGQPTFWRV
jgi:GT2 family glycosyltransferase